MSKKHFAITALIICSKCLHAQDTSIAKQQLDEVVITATKFPIKQSLTGKVVTVITKEQLAKSSGRTISELLNREAGIYINGADNPLGTNQDVYMRGASAGKSLILIDGVP